MIISIIILVPQLDHLDIYIKLIISINLKFKIKNIFDKFDNLNIT